MQKKISISSGRPQLKYGTKEALRICKEAGFDGVDFSLDSFGWGGQPDVVTMPYDEFVAHFKDLRAYADEIGIDIPTAHSLVYSYGTDEEKNEKYRQKAIRDIEACSILGAKYCVIHSVGTGPYGFDTPMEVMHEKNQRMYSDFIATAEKFKVCITLESFGSTKSNGVSGYDHFANHEAMLYEYESLPTEYKAFCLDSGHTNLGVNGGFLSVPDFIRYFGSRIKMLHLHDNNGFSDQHLIPAQGNIDWPAVFDALDEIGYDGYYNYELAPKYGDSLKDGIMFLGKLLREFTDKRGKT